MTNDNSQLGRLLSELPADGTTEGSFRNLIGCGIVLPLLLVVAAVCTIIGAFTDSSGTKPDRATLYISIGVLVVGSVLIVLLFVMNYHLPNWLKKRERLEIYENGFVVKRPVFSPVSCLWRDIQSVDFVSPENYIPKAGEEIVGYKIYRKDGSKIWVNRRYLGMETFDEILIPCGS